jgi:OOP family OmpA-OmpF porin
MKLRNTLLAATILALPLAAKAQPITGLYIGGGAGANIMLDENAQATARGVNSRSANLGSQVGPAVDLSVGYGLGNGLRFELEGDYRYNNFNGTSFSGTSGTASAGGQEQKMGAMANAVYDFVGLIPYVQPYVGVGVGYQWAKDSNLHFGSGPFAVTAPTNTEGSFAYQGIIGASLPVVGVPGLALTLDYRFMGLAGTRNYAATLTSGSTSVPGQVRLSSNYNNTIMVGFRYNFGVAPAPAPAPAPVAVPPSPVSRSYLVFFDWDKASLTDRARQIVAEAAANSTKVQYTQIEVNGYTDTSGTPRYNQGLSVRRAQAVAAELVKDGVPKTAIAIQGFGETHLLVPTGPGVREPQNRRVEIIIK